NQRFGQGLFKVHGNAQPSGNHFSRDGILEVKVGILQKGFYSLIFPINFTLYKRRHWVPLLGRRMQPNIAIGSRALAVMNQLNTTDLGITEQTVIPVAVNQQVDAVIGEIFKVIEIEIDRPGAEHTRRSE